jgi:anti-repressor protein
MAEIMPFQFPATGHLVRTVTIDGQPWFVAADVCATLGIGNARQAVSYLDADEVRQIPVTTNDGSGRTLPTNVVSESGLYSLILRSRKPEAKAFKRWITHEVLPQIRQTGHYDAAPRFEIPQTYAEALRLAATQSEEIEQQRRVLAVAGPKAHAWDTLASADPDYSVREAAYILNRDPAIDTGQNRLFNAMRQMRVIDSRDIPYADHARHVKLRARSFTNRATNEETAAKPQVRITAAGLAYLHKRLGGIAPLRLDEQLAIEEGV